MNVPLEDILTQIYDVELGSVPADFDILQPNERGASSERLCRARAIKKFVSTFGVVVMDFFEQDREGGIMPTSSLVNVDKPKDKETQKASTAEAVEEKSQEQAPPKPTVEKKTGEESAC